MVKSGQEKEIKLEWHRPMTFIQYNVLFSSIVSLDVTIISSSSEVLGNVIKYTTGSALNLTCVVTPTPPPNSVFNWNCSTGCFADVELNQTISTNTLNESDSGEIFCSINGLKYEGDPYRLGECHCSVASFTYYTYSSLWYN